MNADELLHAVSDAFTAAGGDHLGWADPHPDRQVDDDEYSRVSDPGKYRIVTVRTAAWVTALTETGLATAEPIPAPRAPWRAPPSSLADQAHATWLHPVRTGAVPLLLCLNKVGTPEHDYLLVGAGDPAVEVDLVPDRGCDACDSGSAGLLEELDQHVLDVVAGDLVHITLPSGTVCGRGNGWSAQWPQGSARSREDVEVLLEEARAGNSPYMVVRGPAWW
ncbi:DUF6226 family protein [uncultured Pseudokineococcus sp.]|uniref:DUF6226 family protein n=1 Tax=uncultured Pseudokineococcus sp. TaxID=1642928 RepID=UPI0026216AEB|nr:DUF6226 family protein [uncultured Pseudokineococcus sp.]